MWVQTKAFLNTLLLAACLVSMPAVAATKAELDRQVQASLKSLYAKYPAAKTLSKDAKGILVFPEIVKAGLIIGGEGGEGALLSAGKTVDYYSTGGLSVGLQAGAQKYGYVLFFMTDESMGYVQNVAGWEIGVGPSVVVVDAGLAKNLTTTTAKDSVYAPLYLARRV